MDECVVEEITRQQSAEATNLGPAVFQQTLLPHNPLADSFDNRPDVGHIQFSLGWNHAPLDFEMAKRATSM